MLACFNCPLYLYRKESTKGNNSVRQTRDTTTETWTTYRGWFRSLLCPMYVGHYKSISLCLLILHRHSRRHYVSDYVIKGFHWMATNIIRLKSYATFCLKQYTDVQSYLTCAQKLKIEGLLTGLASFNWQSVLHMHYTACGINEKCLLCVTNAQFCCF